MRRNACPALPDRKSGDNRLALRKPSAADSVSVKPHSVDQSDSSASHNAPAIARSTTATLVMASKAMTNAPTKAGFGAR